MKEYEIQVIRLTTQSLVVSIKADSAEEAEKLARGYSKQTNYMKRKWVTTHIQVTSGAEL